MVSISIIDLIPRILMWKAENTMAMISQEGAPSLKVSFQITHIPLEEISAEMGGHDHSETCEFLDFIASRRST